MEQPLWRTVSKFLEKLGIKPPCDPAVPLLGICREEITVDKDTCIPALAAAPFTAARTRKRAGCLSTDKRIKRLRYMDTVEYYSAIKRHAFDSVLIGWMKLEHIIQSEVSQKEKKQISYINAYMWNPKPWY